MPELPTGTVTLLFTDIEHSTQLLQRLGVRYGDVLTEYRALLRSIFQAHDGREVDTQGDSFFVAFPRAVDAVIAAVEIQRALVAHGPHLDSITQPEGEPTLWCSTDFGRTQGFPAPAGVLVSSRPTRRAVGAPRVTLRD